MFTPDDAWKMNKTSVFKKENIYTLFEMSWKKNQEMKTAKRSARSFSNEYAWILDFSLVLAEEQMERIFFFVDAFMVLSLSKASWGQNIGG